MKPLMLQAVWTATWRLPVRCAVTFAMSVSVPAPTEIEQPVVADLGHGALDGLLVGAHRARTELDDRAVAELFGEPIDDWPGRRAVRPAVAEDDRRAPKRSQLSSIASSSTEAPIRMSTAGRSPWPRSRSIARIAFGSGMARSCGQR